MAGSTPVVCSLFFHTTYTKDITLFVVIHVACSLKIIPHTPMQNATPEAIMLHVAYKIKPHTPYIG